MLNDIFRLPWVIKQYGTHLKASAAMVRLRLYDVLSQLPPESFEGRFSRRSFCTSTSE